MKRKNYFMLSTSGGRILRASKLQQAADDLLKKLDPGFADASNELLNELGVKPEDIDPVILRGKSTMK
jgi:hypothetical protein